MQQPLYTVWGKYSECFQKLTKSFMEVALKHIQRDSASGYLNEMPLVLDANLPVGSNRRWENPFDYTWERMYFLELLVN